MTAKIKSIEDLRDFALQTLEDLRDNKIDTMTAATSSKLCESVILTIKTQMEYGRMLDEKPSIPFMYSEKNKLIDIKPKAKALTHKK